MTERPQKPIERARAELDAVKAAEKAIQAVLLNLEWLTGRTIHEVDVFVSPPPNSGYERLSVEIWLADNQGE